MRETAAARMAGAAHRGFDGYAFTISFKGVTAGGTGGRVHRAHLRRKPSNHVALAAGAAGLAVLLVAAAGAAARAPLARVPENTMKLAVGVMLSSYGMFWGAEGAGASWPGRRRVAAGDHPWRAGDGDRDDLDGEADASAGQPSQTSPRRPSNPAIRPP